MQDEIALVTGAGAGIGRAIALRLGSEGAAVVVVDIAAGGADTARRIEADGGRATFVPTDVTVEADLREAFASAERRFGNLSVVVNNAGGAPEPYFPEADPSHWGRTLDLNLRSVMLGIQLGIWAMRAWRRRDRQHLLDGGSRIRIARRPGVRGEQGGGGAPHRRFGPPQGRAKRPRELHLPWLGRNRGGAARAGGDEPGGTRGSILSSAPGFDPA